MNEKLVPPSMSQCLSKASKELQAARQRALSNLDITTTEWEYAGRSWSWPGGEELTYFFDLAPEESDIVDNLVSKVGVDLVGVGTGRVVVSLPESVGNMPTVAKLARYGPSTEMGDGKSQNRREAELWNQINRHPFLPILETSSDFHWVIMPQATIVSENDPDVDTALETVESALMEHQSVFHFDEIKIENIGRYDDSYWIVDYGRPPSEHLSSNFG